MIFKRQEEWLKSWAKTRLHLDAALGILAKSSEQSAQIRQSSILAREFLVQDELCLGCELLEEVGNENDSSQVFLAEVKAARENMKADAHL